MSESTLDGSYFNPNGKLKPFQQRHAERKATEQRMRDVRQAVADRAAKPELSTDQATERTISATIAELKARLKGSFTDNEKSEMKNRLAVLETGHKQIKQRLEESKRKESLASHPQVVLVRENAQSLRSWRSMFPHANEEDVLTAQAIAASDDWDDPMEMVREYNALREKIAADSWAVEDRLASDAKHKALEAEAAAARAAVNAKQAEIKLAQVRSNE